MRLPHRPTLVTAAESADEYGNPVPLRDFGPAAERREIAGLLQPLSTGEESEAGRRAVSQRWRLFTRAEVGVEDRVEWRGRVFDVEGMPEVWCPRAGHRHVEVVLRVREE